jgi:inositol transport system substrate-binding protein
MRRPKTKMTMIIILVLFTLILSGFSIAVAGMDSKPESVQSSCKLVIGCSFDNADETMNAFAQGIARFEMDHPDVQFIMKNANMDPVSQIETIDYLIMNQVDAIVIKPLDLTITNKITQKCADAGIPLIAVGIPSQSSTAVFVSPDNFQAGVMQMEYLAEAAGYKGSIAILQGDSPASQLRTQGNLDVIAKYPGLKIVAVENGMEQRDQGFSITSSLLVNHPDLDLIVANNDEMAIGAVKACQESGSHKILIAGIDATPDALSRVADGSLAATIDQDSDRLGYMAAQSALEAAQAAHLTAQGESVPVNIVMPNILVTPENVADFNLG